MSTSDPGALATSTWVSIEDITRTEEQDARKAKAKIDWLRRYGAAYNRATMDLDRARGARACKALWNSVVEGDANDANDASATYTYASGSGSTMMDTVDMSHDDHGSHHTTNNAW